MKPIALIALLFCAQAHAGFFTLKHLNPLHNATRAIEVPGGVPVFFWPESSNTAPMALPIIPAVPEPSSAWMMLAGLGAIAVKGLRK